MIIASGLRSKFCLLVLFAWVLTLPANAIDPPADTQPADDAATPSLIIRCDSDAVISEVGSPMTWTAEVQSLSEYRSTRMVIRARMLRAADGKEIANQRRILPVDSNGNSEAIEFPFVLPRDAGVVEFRFVLSTDDSRVWSRFIKQSEPIETSGHPVYVVESTRFQNDSTDEDGRTSNTRSAWLLVNNRNWKQALADQSAQRPANDTEFFSRCDPATLEAINIWNTVAQIKRIVEENNFYGARLIEDQFVDDPSTNDATSPAAKTPSDDFIEANLVVDLLTASGTTAVLQPMPAHGVVDLTKLNHMKQDSSQSITPYVKLSLASVLATSDPTQLVVHVPFNEPSIIESVRGSLSTYQLLPTQSMNSVPSIDAANKTVRVRSGIAADGHGYVAVLNLAPWASQVNMEFGQPFGWQNVGDQSSAMHVRESAADPSRYGMTLQPGQLVVLRSEQLVDAVKISSWSTAVAGGMNEIQRIKNDVTAVVERIGLLSDLEPSGSLSNGGFEKSGGLGLIGWMHAQHPPGCVQLDDQESAEGRQSILLATDPTMSARTWIVSETLAPSPSGKMAVSLVTRAERHADKSSHPIRVSIEATRDGEPIRYSNDYEVPRNGSWGSRQIVLEIDGVEKQTIDSMRLTIDSLAGGRLWIDDIRIHYHFPTKRERDDIQSQAFLAVQGLQHGNLTPSARLLQNPWAQNLLASQPRQENRQVQAVEPTEKTPGVAERIRSLLPRPIRF